MFGKKRSVNSNCVGWRWSPCNSQTIPVAGESIRGYYFLMVYELKEAKKPKMLVWASRIHISCACFVVSEYGSTRPQGHIRFCALILDFGKTYFYLNIYEKW